MRWKTLKTGIAVALAIPAVGCSTAAPTSNPTQGAAPAAQVSERSILADGQMTPDQLRASLPKRLTQAEADKVLVSLPNDQVKGPLSMSPNSRSTQQVVSLRYYPYYSYYYPYYSYGSYYYPYSYYYQPYYVYPYYYRTRFFYYPYYFRSRFSYWW